MTQYFDEFINEMAANGCKPRDAAEIVGDGDDHYYFIEGDVKHKHGQYSLTVLSDGHLFGNFYNLKTSDKGSYCSWKKHRVTKIVKENLQQEYEQIAKQRAEENERLKEITAAQELAVWEDADICIDHPYLTKKKVKSHGLRVYNDKLLIPVMDGGKLWMLQYISPDGTKIFSTNGRKKGCYYKMGNTVVDNIIAVSEGYATASAVHEAIETVTYAAFDAGNLLEVVLKARQEYPDADIWVFADNDQWTKNSKGIPYNTGVIKGEEAAKAVGGFVLYPEFPADDPDERTDWDDYLISYGMDKLKEEINLCLEQHRHFVDTKPKQDTMAEIKEEKKVNTNCTLIEGTNGNIEEMPFRILGYDGKNGYFFSNELKQILEFNMTSISMKSLIKIAPLPQWMSLFDERGKSSQMMELQAINALNRAVASAGAYDMNKNIRGTGAWEDAHRAVLHCGDMLYVDGKPTKIEDFNTCYTYISSPRLLRPAPIGLTDREAFKLREICESVTWENKLSGSLLAGWIVTAPLCGILDWRPHLFITGEADSGKSTVINKIVVPAIGPMAMKVDGGTTAPAIRERMDYNARPIIYDEAEKNSDPRIMEGVLELARGSSDGKMLGKRGQKMLECRYSMCFSAVFPPVDKTTDESRIVFMKIKKNRSSNAYEEYQNLLMKIDDTLTPDFSAKLITRTMNNLNNILHNIGVFDKVIRQIIKGARASKQMAILVAGLYSLSDTGMITEEKALTWAKQHDWSYHNNTSDSDPTRIAAHIATSMVRLNQGSFGSVDCSIGDMIMAVMGKDNDGHIIQNKTLAISKLRNSGILVDVKNEKIIISSTSNELKKILKNTDFANGWHNMLMELPGAMEIKNKYFGPGLRCKSCSIPAHVFLVDSEDE